MKLEDMVKLAIEAGLPVYGTENVAKVEKFALAINKETRERCAMVAEIPGMTPSDIARVIRYDG